MVKTFKELSSLKSVEEKIEESLEVTDLPPVMTNITEAKPHDPPAVLIMKRVSIRQFAGGKKVALYYIDKLNKYVTIPYSDLQWSNDKEKSIINTSEEIERIIESKNLDNKTSDDILGLYYRLNETNRKNFLKMAEENFSNLLDFVKANK